MRVVLFDLDGVIRHFDPNEVAKIESHHRLPDGALAAAAFNEPLLAAVTTGRITRADWVRTIGERLGSASAAVEWSRIVPTIDQNALRLSDALRRHGLVTAVLTNGTDTIAEEMAQSGIGRHFDAVFNSAEISYAKPDTRAFRYVLQSLSCQAQQVFFTDDSSANLAGAHQAGMTTHLFSDVKSLRAALAQCGVRISCR